MSKPVSHPLIVEGDKLKKIATSFCFNYNTYSLQFLKFGIIIDLHLFFIIPFNNKSIDFLREIEYFD